MSVGQQPLPLLLPSPEEGESPPQSPLVTSGAAAMSSPQAAAPQPQSTPFGRPLSQPRAHFGGFGGRSALARALSSSPLAQEAQVSDSDSEAQQQPMGGGFVGAPPFAGGDSPVSVTSGTSFTSDGQQAARMHAQPRYGAAPFRMAPQTMQQQQLARRPPPRAAAAAPAPFRSPVSSGAFAGAQPLRQPQYSYAHAQQQQQAAPFAQQRQQPQFVQRQQQPQLQPRFVPAPAMQHQAAMPPLHSRGRPMAPPVQMRGQQGWQRQQGAAPFRGAAAAAGGAGTMPPRGQGPPAGAAQPSGGVAGAGGVVLPEGALLHLPARQFLEAIATPKQISGCIVPFVVEAAKLISERASRERTLHRLKRKKRHGDIQLKALRTRAANAKLSNLAVDAYESVCPPSCESLDAANLEKRLDELRVQFDQRMDEEEDEFQRDQLQDELAEQERILRRSVHDERIRKVKLEAVRRSLLDKLAVANCKFEALKEMAATMSPTDNEEKKEAIAVLLGAEAEAQHERRCRLVDLVKDAPYEQLHELSLFLRLISVGGDAHADESAAPVFNNFAELELSNWIGAANCEPPEEMISVLDMETMRVEGTRRAQLLTKAQLSKSIFTGGGESPGESVPMDTSGEGEGHNGGADLCPAMRDLAITTDLLRRVGPETIAEHEGRTLASCDEADKERTHITAELSARIEAAEREAREEEAEFATVGSVEEGQRTVDRVVADLITFDGQITAHCNQIRDTLAEQREHRKAEREFEESYPRRKEQHARELQEIKAANELFEEHHAATAQVQRLQTKFERLSEIEHDVSLKNEQLDAELSALQKRSEQTQVELSAAQQRRQEHEAAVNAITERQRNYNEAVMQAMANAVSLFEEANQFLHEELPKQRQSGINQAVAETKAALEMERVDKIQAALKAALSVTRGDLDGFKKQLAEIPVKLAEIAAAESELEEFEEQRAAKADLLEVEDVALIDVQSMLDHIAQADEEEAQRREQEAKDKMEREEQERIEEEGAAQEERDKEAEEAAKAAAEAKAKAKAAADKAKADKAKADKAKADKAKADAAAAAAAAAAAKKRADAELKQKQELALAARKRAAPSAASTPPKRPKHGELKHDYLYDASETEDEASRAQVEHKGPEQRLLTVAEGRQRRQQIDREIDAATRRHTELAGKAKQWNGFCETDTYRIFKAGGMKDGKKLLLDERMAKYKVYEEHAEHTDKELQQLHKQLTHLGEEKQELMQHFPELFSSGRAPAKSAAAAAPVSKSTSAPKTTVVKPATSQPAAKPAAKPASKPAAPSAAAAKPASSARPASHVQAKRPRAASPASSEEEEEEDVEDAESSGSEYTERKTAPKKGTRKDAKRPRKAEEERKEPSRTPSKTRVAPPSRSDSKANAQSAAPHSPVTSRAAPSGRSGAASAPKSDEGVDPFDFDIWAASQSQQAPAAASSSKKTSSSKKKQTATASRR